MALDINNMTYDQLANAIKSFDQSGADGPERQRLLQELIGGSGLNFSGNFYGNGDPIMQLHNVGSDLANEGYKGRGSGWHLTRGADGGIEKTRYEYGPSRPDPAMLAVLLAPFAAMAMGAGGAGAAGGAGGGGVGAAGAGTGGALGSGVTLGSGGVTGVTGAVGSGGLTAGAGTGLGFTASGASTGALGSLGSGFFGAETLAGLGAVGGAGLASGTGGVSSASGTSGSIGSGASGAGEIAANPASFSDARFATEIGIDPAYVGSGTATPTFHSVGNAITNAMSGVQGGMNNPWVQLGSSLVSGYMGDRAAGKAADAQRAASEAAIGEQRRQYEQTRADLSPWRERGVGASNRLATMMGLSGNAADPNFNKGYQTAPRYTPNPDAISMQRNLNSFRPSSQNRLASMLSILNQRAGVR